MKKLFILSILVLIVGSVSAVALAGPSPKVEVCHFPPGNPDNFHTINVSQNALEAHLAHGDLGGSCNALCDSLCDDGNACTIDHNGDCEENGCLAAPTPVDCSDENLCTVDSCNPQTGCQNTSITCPAPDLCTVSHCAQDTGECIDSPVSCPSGFSCDLDTGGCVPDAACQTDDDCADGFTCIQGECIEGSARNLRGPDGGSCDGPLVGSTSVVELADDLRVDVEFTNGPPNSSFSVFWVCTLVGGGCHGSACGFVSIGTITTDGSGQGSFSTILANGNPYPGRFVHFDIGNIGSSPFFTSITHDEVFPNFPSLTTQSLSTESVGPLDPADVTE